MSGEYGTGWIESVDLPGDLLKTVEESVSATLGDGGVTGERVANMAGGLSYGRQGIFALAYLYTCDDSSLKGDGRLVDGMRAIGDSLAGEDHFEHRQLWALVEARRRMADAGEGDVLAMTDEVTERSAAVIAERFERMHHLTHMVSANMGTSTNHIAIMSASLLRYSQDESRDEWGSLAREIALKVVGDQTHDGYWAETTGGPTMLYNTLTTCAMGRLFEATGEDVFMHAAIRAAKLHMRFSYPDACEIETVDGRCRYHPTPMMWGGFVFSRMPEGRGHVAMKLKTLLDRRTTAPADVSAEHLALMCEDHMLWSGGEVYDPHCSAARRVETLDVGGMVRREGDWCVTFASRPHIPRPGVRFTIDRQNVFSVWHSSCGLIVNGSGEAERPGSATFRIDPAWEGDHRLQVPETISIVPGDAPGKAARLHCEYRGGTCRIETFFHSDDELEIRAYAGCMDARYPVHLTVPLELSYGDEISWESGSATLTEGQRTDISHEDMGGHLAAPSWTVEVKGAEARLEWPYDPYNPYSEDNTSPTGMHVGLLRIELMPEGASIFLRIRGKGDR